MLTLTSLCAGTLGFVVIIFVGRYLENSGRRLHSYPLPPGPSGLPWVGTVVDVRTPWLTWSEWAKKYGDLIYFRMFGCDIIVINSEKVARDLLEHRSKNYSDRPALVACINDSSGLDFNSALLPYGDRWRLHRRFFHQTFRNDAISRFQPLHFHKSCRLLQQLLIAPDQFSEHLFDYTASIIMNSAYDYDPVSRQDEFMDVIAKVIAILTDAFFPIATVIFGTIPGLHRLPSWFPGMSFKKKIETARGYVRQYVEMPFEHSIQKLSHVGCTQSNSMVHDSIQKAGAGDTTADKAWMKELKGAAASAFLGGAETSNSVLMTFFLLMVLNPEAQEKAQAQIDLVIGGDRLPTIADRPSLPYIDAILREMFRYCPTAPLSLPHSVVNDDVYSGFHIPKGAIVLPNIWIMMRDEAKYPKSDKFIPERFLADDGSLLPDDPARLIFGFGRRICPGRHFADTSVWIVMSMVLATFRISKPRNADGIEVPVTPKFSSGIVAHPLPFSCSIVPRKPGMDARKLEQMIAATTLE